MTGYTEDEVRKAIKALEFYSHGHLEKVIENLREMKSGHLHDFADNDTITVKEIREACKRILPNDCCQKCGASFHAGDKPSDYLLQDISSHREPKYPVNSTWKDADDQIWHRISGNYWKRMGESGGFPDSTPRRPLRRMDVI